MRRLGLIGLIFALSIPVSFAQSDRTFDFRSGFWINLHHFLYEQATSSSPVPSDSKEWDEAASYYKREVIKHSLLSGQIEAANNRLSEAGASLKNSGLAPEWIAALEGAAPEYRERWWAEHDRANRAWIAAVQPLVDRYAAILKVELAKAYGTDWPSQAILTDVTEYAGGNGAYTNINPTHITVSSVAPANAGLAALEILFHEASHRMILDIRDALARETKRQERVLRRADLWHALLFYTAGTFAERHLEGYTMYAVTNGVFDRGWPGALDVLKQDWQPYLDGKIDQESALRRLVAEYSTPVLPKPNTPR
jgi:hypothetical protein